MVSITASKSYKLSDLISTIGLHSGHDASDGVRQPVEGGDGGGVHQLVGDLLQGCDSRAGLAPDTDGGVAGRIDGLEGVLDLVETALGAEDGDVVVKSGAGSSRHFSNLYLFEMNLNLN